MGDKTQILTLLIATRTNKHLLLFLGVMGGFAVSVTLACILGIGLSEFIPHKKLELVSSTAFIIIGVILFFRGSLKTRKQKKVPSKIHFWSIAIVIFLTDFGDKTQIAIALFSTQYHPVLVWLAGMSALAIDTLLVLFFSNAIAKRVKENTVKKIGGGIFIAIGLYILGNNLLTP